MTATARCMLCRRLYEPGSFDGHLCEPLPHAGWCPASTCEICDDARDLRWAYVESEH